MNTVENTMMEVMENLATDLLILLIALRDKQPMDDELVTRLHMNVIKVLNAIDENGLYVGFWESK